MPTLLVTLPYDIVTTIVNELVSGPLGLRYYDKRTLTSCSLISASFREACQLYLYRSITLHVRHRSKSSNDQLHEILLQNPRIASFVRHLHIWFYSASSENLAGTLRMLPRVYSLKIEHQTNTFHWRYISFSLRADILGLLQLSSLEHVSVQDIHDFPISSFSRCPQLKKAILGHCSTSDMDILPSEPLSLFSRGYLESLTMNIPHTCDRLATVLAHPSSLSLSRLRICRARITDHSDTAVFQTILDTSAPFVEDVRIELRNGTDPRNPTSIIVLIYPGLF